MSCIGIRYTPRAFYIIKIMKHTEMYQMLSIFYSLCCFNDLNHSKCLYLSLTCEQLKPIHQMFSE